MSNKISFAGKFKLIAVRPDGSERLLADWFDNLIVNTGLNSLGSQTNLLNICKVGSGSNPPAVTDTILTSTIAETTNRTGEGGAATAAPWYKWTRFKYRFGQGVAAGNVSEIGIFNYAEMWSRSLVKDPQGNATTVTILSDEVLDVYYELRIYPPENDVVGTFVIDGTSHEVTVRAAFASSASWADFFGGVTNTNHLGAELRNGTDLGPVTGEFGAGTSTQVDEIGYPNFSWFTYISGSYQRKVRMSVPLDRGNLVNGIGGLKLSTSFGQYQVKFNPPLPKDATKVLNLDFMVSWARRAS